MSERTQIVDWGLGERTAVALIGGLPVPGRPAAPIGAGFSQAELERVCAESLAAASAYAGLGTVSSSPAPELIDRDEWARSALSTLAAAARPLEARLAADLDLPGPLGGLARRAAGAAFGIEVGVAAGYAARRVLGQYDLPMFEPDHEPRLLFVGSNIESVRGELGAGRELFLRWVALHECTHVVQFETVEWLAPHMRDLAGAVLESAAEGIDAEGLVSVGRRLLRDPRELVRALLRGELARLLADPERSRLLDRLQATMAVIEGHAEHVMDAAAADLGPGIGGLRRGIDARRARRGGIGELIGRLLGMDLKLRQYELGKAFCDEIAREGGSEALRALWRSPDDLPDLAELERPREWLGRVAPVAAL